MVAEERVENSPVTTCQMVAEERVQPYEVRTCSMVAEERVENCPGHHLPDGRRGADRDGPGHDLPDGRRDRLAAGPVCVPEQVPVTVNRCVARRWLARSPCRLHDGPGGRPRLPDLPLSGSRPRGLERGPVRHPREGVPH